MQMTPERWSYTSQYVRDVFGSEDEALRQLRAAAEQQGLPAIAISADVGHLLSLLTSLTAGRRALELGTLGGYSAVWIARGLHDDGHLTTVERSPEYARFARQQLQRCGVGPRCTVKEGDATEVLDALVQQWPAGSVDLCFMDATKSEYPAYFERVRDLIAPGGLLIADNVLGSSAWWIDDVGHPDREGAHALNQLVASDPGFESCALPLREGLLVARRR